MALKIALAAKAKVVVTSSSQQKIDNAKAMGALGGVSYKEPYWPYMAMKLLPQGENVLRIFIFHFSTEKLSNYQRLSVLRFPNKN